MIFLNWDDPEDDGGSDLTGFIVERRDAKMHTWRQPVETASSKCECVGIMEGQEYMFRVIAKNKYGLGPPVELGPIKAVDPQGKPCNRQILVQKYVKGSIFETSCCFGIPPGPPSYPEKFHYTERTKDSITLAWKPPRNDGGSPVIGYFVEKKRQDQQAFEPCNTEICPNMSITVEGLDEAWMYEFRIKCANLIGESEPSIPLTVVIQDDEGKVPAIYVVNGSIVSNAADLSGSFLVPSSVPRDPHAETLQGRLHCCEEGRRHRDPR